MQCNSCGATLREDSAFCRACGAGVDHATPMPEPQPEYLPEPEFASLPVEPPAKSKNTTLLIVLIAILATLVLVVGFLVLEQQLGFIGLFGGRQPSVSQENGDDTATTMPAEDTTQLDDSALQNQLGLPPTPAMFYTTANLHLRAAPSAQAESIVVVAAGTRVNVIHYHNAQWFRVQRGSDVGYMSSEFLSETFRINIASPAIWNADRAALERVFGRGLSSGAWNPGDGTRAETLVFDYGVSINVVTWREGGRDHFRVHQVSVEFDDSNRTRFHLNGVDGETTRNGILNALGDPTNAWTSGFHYRVDDNTSMGVNFNNNRVTSFHRVVTFADHHYWGH